MSNARDLAASTANDTFQQESSVFAAFNFLMSQRRRVLVDVADLIYVEADMSMSLQRIVGLLMVDRHGSDWAAQADAEIAPATDAPTESTGVKVHSHVWICDCCMLALAADGCADETHEYEPLSTVPEHLVIVPGGEHASDCDGECDGECEWDSFSMSECDACGDPSHGERRAATLFYR